MASGWTGGRRRRTDRMIEGEREAIALCATLGRGLRSAREARGLTQQAVGARIGLSHSRYGDLERGRGAGAPLGIWIAAGLAVGKPLAVSLSRGSDPLPSDAGHLSAQELILRLAQAHGIPGSFELQTRSTDSARSVDVCLRDDAHRVLIIVEVTNRLDDLGASARGLHRKLEEAEMLAVAIGGDAGAYRVAGCWVLRSTAQNRALVARYPAIIDAHLPGSSREWVEALTTGSEPPAEPGLVWVDLAGTRLFERRAPQSGAR